MRWSLFVAVFACGGQPTEAADGGKQADGSAGADAPTEEAATKPRCDRSKPFAPPVRVPGFDTPGEAQSTRFLSDDELTMHVDAGPVGQLRAPYIAKRSSRTAPFGPLVPLEDIRNGYFTGMASLTKDELAIYFVTNQPFMNHHTSSIFVARRSSTSEPFGLAVGIDTQGNATQPFITADGKTLYFSTGSTLRAATCGDSGCGPPVNLGIGKAPDEEKNKQATAPVVSRDELTLYFGGEHFATYLTDVATRASKSEPFGDIKTLTELKVERGNTPGWISPDECTIYINVSSIEDGSATTHIYSATRPL